jgi:plasmid maintenance system killer protein
MEIEYGDTKVRKYCYDNRVALSRFGEKVAKKLKKIIAILHSAKTMADVSAVQPKAHWLQGDRHWQISIPLADGKSLVIEPVRRESREWAKLDSIKIIAVENYHK